MNRQQFGSVREHAFCSKLPHVTHASNGILEQLSKASLPRTRAFSEAALNATWAASLEHDHASKGAFGSQISFIPEVQIDARLYLRAKSAPMWLALKETECWSFAPLDAFWRSGMAGI